jgi:nucleoside-diphosphate-sugar epimerase
LKILLTGATGFTGRHFSAMAQALGHEIMPLQAKLSDRLAIESEVLATAPEAVVHLAAISFVGHADDAEFYAVNVVGTTNLLAALTTLPKPLRCVLLASSANVYGNCLVSPISEIQNPAPINHYAMSKLAMEHMAHTYADRLPIVITRPFNYTGVGQDVNFVIPKLITQYSRRAPMVTLGNLHVEREFNDVHMVCNTYLELLQFGEPGETYNVCSGQPYTLQKVIDTLTLLTGHHLHVEINPTFVRANEVHRLCGDPTKLQTLMAKCGLEQPRPTLQNTLCEMLTAAGTFSV